MDKQKVHGKKQLFVLQRAIICQTMKNIEFFGKK